MQEAEERRVNARADRLKARETKRILVSSMCG